MRAFGVAQKMPASFYPPDSSPTFCRTPRALVSTSSPFKRTMSLHGWHSFAPRSTSPHRAGFRNRGTSIRKTGNCRICKNPQLCNIQNRSQAFGARKAHRIRCRTAADRHETPLNHETADKNMTNLELTADWDKTFPQSDKVNHSKVTFTNRYGITLALSLIHI